MLICIPWVQILVVWLLMKMHITSKEVIGHPHYFGICNVLKMLNNSHDIFNAAVDKRVIIF